jgi:hypothetical protein
MAASLSLRVYTGAGPTESAAKTGIDLISADNDENSLANRQANPITVATRSYEKWTRLKIDTAPANGVTNFKIWLGGDGTISVSTTLFFTANYATYQQGTTAASTIANTAMTNFTAGNKATWDTASYSATGSITRAAIFQLAVAADAQPGNWSQETVSYSYDET